MPLKPPKVLIIGQTSCHCEGFSPWQSLRCHPERSEGSQGWIRYLTRQNNNRAELEMLHFVQHDREEEVKEIASLSLAMTVCN